MPDHRLIAWASFGQVKEAKIANYRLSKDAQEESPGSIGDGSC